LGFSVQPDSAAATDLCVAVTLADARAAASVDVKAAVAAWLNRADIAVSGHAARLTAASLDGALELLPESDLALISVPGDYAAAEAERALDLGLNVFLFSDNVSLADEHRLKMKAARRRLL